MGFLLKTFCGFLKFASVQSFSCCLLKTLDLSIKIQFNKLVIGMVAVLHVLIKDSKLFTTLQINFYLHTVFHLVLLKMLPKMVRDEWDKSGQVSCGDNQYKNQGLGWRDG